MAASRPEAGLTVAAIQTEPRFGETALNVARSIEAIERVDARRKRNWNAFDQILRDRRSDAYGERLGSTIARGWY